MWDEVNAVVSMQIDLSQRYFLAFDSDYLPSVNLIRESVERNARVYTMKSVELLAHMLAISWEVGDNVTGKPMDVLRLTASILADGDRKIEVRFHSQTWLRLCSKQLKQAMPSI